MKGTTGRSILGEVIFLGENKGKEGRPCLEKKKSEQHSSSLEKKGPRRWGREGDTGPARGGDGGKSLRRGEREGLHDLLEFGGRGRRPENRRK